MVCAKIIRISLCAVACSSSIAVPAIGSSPVQGVLPARVVSEPGDTGSRQDGSVESWDINGDGYPDMVRVKKGRPDPTGVSAETAFDFDADGKPDFFRSETGPQGAAVRPVSDFTSP